MKSKLTNIKKTIKVLIVEDSKSDTENIIGQLESYEFTVHYKQVNSKSSFIDALNSADWEIILCDYLMTDISCTDILTYLREKEMDIPIIIVSGNIDDDTAVKAMRNGATDYVMKDNLKRLAPAVEREVRDARIRHERWRIEKELLNAKIMLDKTFQSLEEAVFIIDPKKRTILTCNPAAEKIFGYTKIDLIGKKTVILHVDEASYDKFGKDSLKILNRVGVYYTEFRMKRKNGEVFFSENTVTEILDNNGQRSGIVSVVRDITHRKKAEKRLMQSEIRFRKLIENAPDGVALIGPDEIFQYVSPSALRIFGYTPDDDIAGLNPNDLTHPDDLPGVQAGLLELIKNPQKNQTLQYRFRHKDGSWRWIESTFSNLLSEPGLEGIVINFRDIHYRKMLEEKLKFHSHLLDEIGEAVMATDLNGNLTYWNNAAEKLYGWMADEVIGKNVINITPSTSTRNQAEEVMNSMKSGENWSGEFILRRKDGSEFPGFVTNSPVINDGGELIGIIGISKNISEQKKAEEQIRFQASLLDQVNNGVLATDIEGKIIYWNKYAEELHGWSKKEVIGKKIVDFLVAEESIIDEAEYYREFEKNNRWSGEVVLLRKDGSTFPAFATHTVIRSAEDEIIGTVAVSIDLTEQKIIEQEMFESQRQLELQGAALESAANAIAITDHDGIVQWVNSSFVSLTGYSMDEAIGSKPNLLKSGKMSDEFFKEMWQTVLRGEVWTGELINRRKDGKEYDEKMTITPVKNNNGETTHYVAIKEDISSEKELHRQLIQTQKLESIGTLASGIAHDFNNILGIILGYCTLLERSRENKESFKENLNIVKQAVNRGSNLVKQILTFARKTDVTNEIVNINKTVRELTQMLKETFPKSITVDVNLDKNVPSIIIDQTQLNQALLNLCVNARDAILDKEKPYGKITVRSGYLNGKKLQPRFPDAVPDKYVFISVADTGTGIEKSVQDRIFDPFFTTKEADKGTGLGLSLVYGVVKTYNGFIDLESEVGEGTKFTLYLPVYQQIEEGDTGILSEGKADATGSETLLVVEDEEQLRNVLTETLDSQGYNVILANNGEDAVRKYSEHKDEIALVLSDVGLPKMSGIELFNALLKINPEVKVILASGFIEPGLSSELYKKGIKEIIHKPYELTQLLHKIRTTLDA